MRRFLSGILSVFCTGCAVSSQFGTGASGEVTLYLNAPDARSVVFLSSRDNYLGHALDRDADGLWVKKGLADEEFRYFYLVDGNVLIPDCRYREADDFGQVNCIHLPGTDSRRRPATVVQNKE
jgi:hypothetical protein